jgi:predicted secreted protein
MSWFGALVVFTIVWWMVFFLTLPFGITAPDEPEPGHATSAPVKPRLWLKASITTVIAVALTSLAAIAVEYQWIAFREMIE